MDSLFIDVLSAMNHFYVLRTFFMFLILDSSPDGGEFSLFPVVEETEIVRAPLKLVKDSIVLNGIP
jgi:hypothetical protein